MKKIFCTFAVLIAFFCTISVVKAEDPICNQETIDLLYDVDKVFDTNLEYKTMYNTFDCKYSQEPYGGTSKFSIENYQILLFKYNNGSYFFILNGSGNINPGHDLVKNPRALACFTVNSLATDQNSIFKVYTPRLTKQSTAVPHAPIYVNSTTGLGVNDSSQLNAAFYSLLTEGLTQTDGTVKFQCPKYASIVFDDNNGRRPYLILSNSDSDTSSVFKSLNIKAGSVGYRKEYTETIGVRAPDNGTTTPTEPSIDPSINYSDVEKQFYGTSEEFNFAVSEFTYPIDSDPTDDSTANAAIDMYTGNICEMTGTLKVLTIIRKVIHLLKIAVPLALVILASIELGKAVISDDSDSVAKTLRVLVRKIIMGVVIFFIPVIIDSLMSLVNNYEKNKSSVMNCLVCFFGDDNHSDKTCKEKIDYIESLVASSKRCKKDPDTYAADCQKVKEYNDAIDLAELKERCAKYPKDKDCEKLKEISEADKSNA